MRIVCWQTILMKYHSLFLTKISKDTTNLSSAAVSICALRVNHWLDQIFPKDQNMKQGGTSFVDPFYYLCFMFVIRSRLFLAALW